MLQWRRADDKKHLETVCETAAEPEPVLAHQALQLKVDEHETPDTANQSPRGSDDEPGMDIQMDILFNTMVALYNHQTAEDYVFNTRKSLYGQQTAEDYMTQAAQSPSATPCEVKPTDTRPQALQVKGYEHKALGTANHLPRGNDDEPGRDAQMNILFNTMVSLYNHQTS